jgi:hypothetical protein
LEIREAALRELKSNKYLRDLEIEKILMHYKFGSSKKKRKNYLIQMGRVNQ